MSDSRIAPSSRPQAANGHAAVFGAAHVRSPEQLIDDLSRFLSNPPDEVPAANTPRPHRNEAPHARNYMFDDDEFDDTPMPIPSTWRTTEPHREERAWFAEQSWAAVLGFVVGLVILVPAVLYATARFGGLDLPNDASNFVTAASVAEVPTKAVLKPATPPVERALSQAGAALPTAHMTRMAPEPVSARVETAGGDPSDIAVTSAPEVKVVEPVVVPVVPTAAHSQTRTAAAPPPKAVPPQPLVPLASKLPTLAQARQVVGAGNIPAGRKLLAQLASSGDAQAMFALAETYDPNMLAAWAVLDIEPDAGKARLFYAMALSNGLEAARKRLEALE